MNSFEITLAILITGILVISFFYTLLVGRQQKVIDGDLDRQISKPIQKNVYLKNPIFLSYGIFFALLLFIILFFTVAFYE